MKRFRLAAILLALSFLPRLRAAQVAVSWDGGAGTTSWNDANNWSTNVVPNNGAPAGTTYAVTIDTGFAVNLTFSTTIDTLTIGAGASLTVNQGTSFEIAGSSIVNAGTLLVNSTGGTTELLINAAVVTLSGGGALMMSNSINNRILGGSSTFRLVNVDNTISGAGQILGMALTNQGTITANLSAGLVIDPSASGAINSGTMRATSASSLTLQGGNFDNTGGLIRADSSAGNSVVQVISTSTVTGGTVDLTGAGNGELRLASSSITGGTVTNNTTGTIRAQSGTNTLSGAVTNPAGGQVIVANGATLGFNVSGTYNNGGNISLGSTGSPTTLQVAGGNVTLSGGGSVTMTNNVANRITGAAGTDRLVNANNTISGAGQIGVNLMALTNQGTIIADQPAGIVIDPSASGAINSGSMRATNASSLTLQGGTFDNTGGLIRADSSAGNSVVQMTSSSTVTGGTVDLTGAGNGELRLASSSITGGTVTNNATGTIRAQSGTSGLGGIVTNPSGGVIVVPNSSVLQGAGTWTNGGTIQVDAGGVLNHPLGYTQSAGSTHLNGSMIGVGTIALQGGVLDGGGATTGNVSNTGGTIAPGTSPGILGTGNVSMSAASALAVELNGTTVGTQYDQLNVTGTVSLGNAALNVSVGFSPMTGQTFTIINNDLGEAVSGTFAGLPQGAGFIAGGSGFTISYMGGSGNDVVLAAIPCTSIDSTGPAVTAPAATTVTQTQCN